MQCQFRKGSFSQHKWFIVLSLLIAIGGSLIFSASIPETYCSIKQISVNASEDRIETRTKKLNWELDIPTIKGSNVTTEPKILKILLESQQLMKLMGEQKVTTVSGQKLKLQDYLLYEKVPWWKRGRLQPTLTDRLQNCMMTEVNLHNGIISIKGMAQDPLVACQITEVAARALNITLQKYTHRIALLNAEKLEREKNTQRSKYLKALKQYAIYVDGNATPTLMKERSKIDSLQKNIDISLEACNKANMQYELAHMKENRQTIYFITIHNETIAECPTHPRTFVNLVIWTMYALLIDFWYVSLHRKYKQRIHAKQ